MHPAQSLAVRWRLKWLRETGTSSYSTHGISTAKGKKKESVNQNLHADPFWFGKSVIVCIGSHVSTFDRFYAVVSQFAHKRMETIKTALLTK